MCLYFYYCKSNKSKFVFIILIEWAIKHYFDDKRLIQYSFMDLSPFHFRWRSIYSTVLVTNFVYNVKLYDIKFFMSFGVLLCCVYLIWNLYDGGTRLVSQ